MARQRRLCPGGLPQHVIQRGNNRSVCFAASQDFSAYAYWLKEYAEKNVWKLIFDLSLPTFF